MLSGCVAALAAPFLITGGSMAAGDAWMDGLVKKQARRQASAEAIGQDLDPRGIKVSKVEKEGDTIRWTADTAVGRYSCSAMKGKVHATCLHL